MKLDEPTAAAVDSVSSTVQLPGGVDKPSKRRIQEIGSQAHFLGNQPSSLGVFIKLLAGIEVAKPWTQGF